MRQLAIISGKGGTGKTSLAACFVALAQSSVAADCDVDAANLSLLLSPTHQQTVAFSGGVQPRIDRERCTDCGRCYQVCRWHAISEEGVDELACEGCSLCSRVCPENAITMHDALSGHWYVSDTAYGPLVHAELLPGAGNSGKLVTLVRKRATELAQSTGAEWVIIDGPPGTGCPVMAALSGVSSALVVTEPSQSGRHDLERTVALCRHFGIGVQVCINRYDISLGNSREIKRWCAANDVPELTRIPYDPIMIKSVVAGEPAILNKTSSAAHRIANLWEQLCTSVKSRERD